MTRSDEDYGGMVLAQAHAVVPRVQAYRARAADRRNTAPAQCRSAVASLQRQIERLLRERRLRLATKLIDQFNLALQTGSVAPALALTLDEVRTQVTQLFPSAGEKDTFGDKQIQLAQETDPLILPRYYPPLNRGSGSGVFTSDTETRDKGANLLTELCNKMLARQIHSPLWLLSSLVLIPKPADSPLTPLAPGANPPSTPVTLRPLGLPEIFYRLAGRAAARIEGPLVCPTTAPDQLGVGIPFGCQIGAKGAQCAFDTGKAVSTWDGNSAFNTEPRQDTFSDVSDRAPRLLRYYVWCYGRPMPLLWCGQRVGWSATGRSSWPPLLRRQHIPPLLFNPGCC